MAEILINDVNPRAQYTAAGGETSFSYPFPIFDSSHLVVQKTQASDLDNPVTLVIGVDYTVSGVGLENGGSISLLSGPFPSGAVATDIFTLYRDVPYERLNDYQFSGGFEASEINRDLDIIVMMVQQLNRLLNATVRLKETDALASLSLKVSTSLARAGRALSFNAAGDGLEEGPTTTDIANAAPNAAQVAADRIAVAADRAAVEAITDNIQWQDVIYRTFADGTLTITAGSRGRLYVFDTSGGPITVNLPTIASLTTPPAFTVGFKKSTPDANAVTINRGGADTIDGATSKDLSISGASTTLISDNTPSPDQWNALDTGGPLPDGAVSTAAKIVDGIITFAKMASAAIATSAEIIAGTASKIVTASVLKSAYPRMVVDSAYAEYTGSKVNGTEVMPTASAPQITDGFEVCSVTITPKTTTNKFQIWAIVPMIAVDNAAPMSIAVFKNGTSGCLKSNIEYGMPANAGYNFTPTLFHEFTPATLSAVTISLRCGGSGGAGRFTLNGNHGGSRCSPSLFVQEVTS